MCTNRTRASEGTVGVTLLRIREGVVFHLIVPSLNMERRWPISGEISGYKHRNLTFKVVPSQQVKGTSSNRVMFEFRAGCFAEVSNFHG